MGGLFSCCCGSDSASKSKEKSRKVHEVSAKSKRTAQALAKSYANKSSTCEKRDKSKKSLSRSHAASKSKKRSTKSRVASKQSASRDKSNDRKSSAASSRPAEGVASSTTADSQGTKPPAELTEGLVGCDSVLSGKNKMSAIDSTALSIGWDSDQIRANVRFQDERPNPLHLSTTRALRMALEGTRLYRDQKLRKTNTGEAVNGDTCPFRSLFTHKRLKRARVRNHASADMNKILHEPFSKLDKIVEGLYITGVWGLVQEDLKKEKVALIINATHEWVLLKDEKIASYRVPVSDSVEANIADYFDDVADLIESTRRKSMSSVVHCVAGVSRSSTLVLAYLLKYTNLNLHTAFRLVVNTRTCIRPNSGFWRELIKYELKLKGQNSIELVEINGVQVPNFYKKEFPSLFEHEVRAKSRTNSEA